MRDIFLLKTRILPVAILLIFSAFFLYKGNSVILLITLILLIGITLKNQLTRKISIAYFLISSLILIFAFYPMNIEAEKTFMWNLEDKYKAPIFLTVQMIIFLTIYSLRTPFNKAISFNLKIFFEKIAVLSLVLILLGALIYTFTIFQVHNGNPNFLKIDSCLDRGGCWDHSKNNCELKKSMCL